MTEVERKIRKMREEWESAWVLSQILKDRRIEREVEEFVEHGGEG